MKPIHKRLLLGVFLLAVLAVAFWFGGNGPSLRGWEVPSVPTTTPSVPTQTEHTSLPPVGTETAVMPTASVETKRPTASNPPSTPTTSEVPETPMPSSSVAIPSPEPEKDKYLTDTVPQGKPIPVEPEEVEIGDAAYTCTLSIRCDAILENIDWLDEEKRELVPADGVIFPATEVTFYEGESVFDLLLRETKRNGIHMEFVNTPIYNSAYIEGIYNLYEFDCGEQSGWMYRVNGWFPNYGCSRYALQPGDTVEWVYTCDLGADVGQVNLEG